MEVEDKIINEIQSYYAEDSLPDLPLLPEINKIIIYEAVKVEDKEKTDRDALNYIENKLRDLF